MKASKEIIEFIAKEEGFRSHPYRDAVGVCTIGYGTTHYTIGGSAVHCDDHDITKETAIMLLTDEINNWYGPKVSHMVRKGTTQKEFDALLSFAYNLGVNALRKSTLLKRHNQGQKTLAAREFDKWVHAGGRVLVGLVKRRDAESKIYLSAVA